MELERKLSEHEEATKPKTVPSVDGAKNLQAYQEEEKKPTASELDHDEKAAMEAHFEEVRVEFVKNINFTVFSKTKFDEGLEDDQLLEQARKRFENSLPLQHIDVVLVQSLEEIEVNEDATGENAENPVASIQETGSIG